MAIRLEISGFTYVDRTIRIGGKALRFTWGIHVDGPAGAVGELCIEGCLAYYRDLGELVWSPPISRWGYNCTRQMHWINPYFYNLTLDALKENPRLLRPVYDIFLQLIDTKKARDAGEPIAPDLPKKLNIPDVHVSKGVKGRRKINPKPK